MDIQPWFAVRCLFDHPSRKAPEVDHLYEERITLWRAASFEEAFVRAEKEARHYAATENCLLVDVSEAFHLFVPELNDGVEVFSLLRSSNLPPDTYRSTFCATPNDRMQDAPSFREANGS